MDIEREREKQIRLQICEIGRMLHRGGHVSACDGNISVRLSEERVLCSPTSISKGMMEPDDLVVVDVEGNRKEGKRRPSTELLMHLLFYRLRPDVMAVVHAHPPTATGFASTGITLDQPLVAEIIVTCGRISLAPYGTPGSQELSDSLRPLVPRSDAILMANHGVVTCGHDLFNAYMKMEAVEHYAKIVLVAHQLGSTRPLPSEEIEKLMQIRNSYAANKAECRKSPPLLINSR